MRRSFRVITHCYQFAWPQELHEFGKNLFADLTLPGVVTPVAEGFFRFMRMQRKDIPQENGCIHTTEHSPDDRCGSFRDKLSFCWSLQ